MKGLSGSVRAECKSSVGVGAKSGHAGSPYLHTALVHTKAQKLACASPLPLATHQLCT